MGLLTTLHTSYYTHSFAAIDNVKIPSDFTKEQMAVAETEVVSMQPAESDEQEVETLNRTMDLIGVKEVLASVVKRKDDGDSIDQSDREKMKTAGGGAGSAVQKVTAEPFEPDGQSLVEILKKSQLLSFFLHSKNWEEDLFESSIRVDIPGINANELSREEQLAIENELLQSFNKVMNQLDYSVVTSYFMDKDDVEQDDAYYSCRDRWNELVEDMLCGMGVKTDQLFSDDVVSKLNEVGRDSIALLRLSSPLRVRHCFWLINKSQESFNESIVELWQEEFKRSLAESGYDTFREVDGCVITLERVSVVEQRPRTKSDEVYKDWRDELVRELLRHRVAKQ